MTSTASQKVGGPVHGRRRIVGTHVYLLPGCAHRVWQELHGETAQRRDKRPEEEFLLQRGRDHEADFVAGLDWPEPQFDRGDWEAGARQTLEFLEQGVPGVLQGVLLDDEVGGGSLGIPDLLRREPGASRFGDFHYVVGDVKSSRQPRGDQLLQAAFYARQLTRLQERAPDYIYLVLKDGREERFPLARLEHAVDDVLERVVALRDREEATRPFPKPACDGCRWSPGCEAELARRDDLGLVAGMTEGLRESLEEAGVCSAGELAAAAPEQLAGVSHIEPAQLRRLVRAAAARQRGVPLAERVAPLKRPRRYVYAHALFDSYAERLLWLGILVPGVPGDELHLDVTLPEDDGAAFAAFLKLLGEIPDNAPLLHHGRALPQWIERQSLARGDAPWFLERFVDIGRRLRGAATWPGPVFGLAEQVQFGLGLDPHRAGRAGEAAWRAGRKNAAGWLEHKGHADLLDLAALDRSLLQSGGGGAS